MMEEILNLQNKYASVNVMQLEEFVIKRQEQINQIIYERDQHLKENEDKVKELESEFILLKESIHNEQQILEQKNKELSKHHFRLAELKSEYDKLAEERQNLEVKKNRIKNTKPNQEDQKLLETGRKKFHLYKNLTGIHWDYSIINDSIEGYVSNKMNYIHHFKFSKDEKDPEELSNLLWHEIYLSVENILNGNQKNSSK
ncbi:PREDICTED: golgin subfamily A member 6-like protein 1 [Polistes dominula]|uniref:Golgin subfamily A member 6-like protein 1 n=1 Tax=Polistes dominula TaxID=743375 RepID=A0ABM1IV49_POLDO|nr:PREDICTED: golgin subfamily A member 6-like protein 1 [Polistes dominula]